MNSLIHNVFYKYLLNNKVLKIQLIKISNVIPQLKKKDKITDTLLTKHKIYTCKIFSGKVEYFINNEKTFFQLFT